MLKKRNDMKRNKLYLMAGLFALAIAACDDANDWEYDPSHDRPFRPTQFETVEELPTSVQVSFNGVTDATKYVFEFSKGDSLLFNNIVRTDEVKADTLTPYNDSPLEISTEYRIWFQDLDGTSRYSIRLKGVDEVTGRESAWIGLCFDTPNEQIFTQMIPGTNSAVLQWDIEKEANTIHYGEEVELEPETETTPAVLDTLWAEPITLTPEQLQAGEITLSGLKSGTNYIAQIYNNSDTEEVLRGTYKFRTLGSATSAPIIVNAGDDINALLAGQVGDVTLSFNGGTEYTAGEITIPATVENLYFAGNTVGGQLPKLTMSKFVFSAPMNNFYVQYMDIVSDGASQFLVEIGDANCFKNITFEGCNISEVNRSVVRLNSGDAEVEGITINNCFIHNVALGGYGLLNIGKAKSLQSIAITNNTLWNLTDQIIDLRVEVAEFEYTQNTFYNDAQTGIAKFFRLDKQPKSITVTSSIFAGPNGGSKTNAGNSDYGWLSYAGCYRTADMQIDKREFTDAKVLELTAADLFVDPDNGDFHFKPERKFEGDGEAGASRWWSKYTGSGDAPRPAKPDETEPEPSTPTRVEVPALLYAACTVPATACKAPP